MSSTVSSTLRSLEEVADDFWSTRPHRHHGESRFTGVSAALGRRYHLDPLLFRLTFVALTLVGGIGLVLYTLAWLVLPVDGDTASPGEDLLGRGYSSVARSRTYLASVILVLAAIATSGIVSLVALVVALAGLYLLHRDRGDRSELLAEPATLDTAAHPDDRSACDGDGQPAQGWDPLAANPMGWQFYPGPATDPHVRRQADEAQPTTSEQPTGGPVAKIGLITLAVLLATGMAMWSVLFTAGSTGWLQPPVAWAILLAVTGAGLVVGSVLRAGRGLWLLALPLLLITAFTTADLNSGMAEGTSFGSHRWSPHTPDQVLSQYRLAGGRGTLDLRGVGVPGGEVMPTTAEVMGGELVVLVPADTAVTAHCSSWGGSMQCIDQKLEGGNDSATISAAGDPGAGRINLTAKAFGGRLEVRHG